MAELHVVSALVRKRAELAGEIAAAERHLERLRINLVHLDATLRLFDPDAVPEDIPPKRPRRKGWFADGELPRRVLNILRGAAPEPLGCAEIARRLMTERGMDAADVPALRIVEKRVHGYLTRRSRGLVERVQGEGRSVRWRVAVRAAAE